MLHNQANGQPPHADGLHVEAVIDNESAVKVVAVFELLKGMAAVLMAGLISYYHQDLPKVFALLKQMTTWAQQPFFNQQLTWLEVFTHKNWVLIVLGVVAYAGLRFVESMGLWLEKAWAYWLAVLGYGVYIPVEAYYLLTQPSIERGLLLLLNVVIVVVVYRNMRRHGYV